MNHNRQAQARIAPKFFQPVARRCPICSGESGRQVYDITHDVCGIGRVSFGMKCCGSCGMVYQSPLTSPNAIERQYEAFSNYTFTAPTNPPLSMPGKRILAALNKARLEPGRAFDVGTATGDFLHHLRECGWSVGGCDPSPKAAEFGRSFYGIDIVVGGEEDCLPQQSALDLIVFSHVLEHLPDPVRTLRRANAALARKGYVAFEFPCLVRPQELPPAFFMMEHFNYFSEMTTQRLLAEAGFSPVIVEISFWDRHYPVITVVATPTEEPRADLLARSDYERAIELCGEYAERERALWAEVDRRLSACASDGRPVAIWGAGLHTSALLERSNILSIANVTDIFDRDPQKDGHSLRGIRITAGTEFVPPADRTIVISSHASEPEIVEALSSIGVASQRIVRLYS